MKKIVIKHIPYIVNFNWLDPAISSHLNCALLDVLIYMHLTCFYNKAAVVTEMLVNTVCLDVQL